MKVANDENKIIVFDFDLGPTNTNDKTTNTASPPVTYNTEQKFTTGTGFYIRDKVPVPWLQLGYGGDATVTAWILKWKSSETPTDNPDIYYSGTESINPTGTGDNIISYYKGSRSSTTSSISGPTITVNWSLFPSIPTCIPSLSGNWTITSDCQLQSSKTAFGNIFVQSGAVFSVPQGTVLTFNFKLHKIQIDSGSAIFIQAGTKIAEA